MPCAQHVSTLVSSEILWKKRKAHTHTHTKQTNEREKRTKYINAELQCSHIKSNIFKSKSSEQRKCENMQVSMSRKVIEMDNRK